MLKRLSQSILRNTKHHSSSFQTSSMSTLTKITQLPKTTQAMPSIGEVSSTLPLHPIATRGYSSMSILTNLLKAQDKLAMRTISKFQSFHSVADLIETSLREKSRAQSDAKTVVDQLLKLHHIEPNWYYRNYYTFIYFKHTDPNYYSNLKNVMLELDRLKQLNQTSFDKLNVKSIANSLNILKEMKLYNDKNVKFLFSLNNYAAHEQIETILNSFQFTHELSGKDYSFDKLSEFFEFIKNHTDAIPGIASLTRSAIEWKPIVELLKESNGAQFFNDKTYIMHLVYKYNLTLRLATGEHRKIIKETLKLLNEDPKIIAAVVKELKNDPEQYRFISNDVLLTMISLAKESRLPSQLESLESVKKHAFKP